MKKHLLRLLFGIIPAIVMSSCGFVEETEFIQNRSGPSGPPWWNAGWSHRRQLVLDNSAQAGNLRDFPLTVKLSDTRISYDSTQDNGEDIRFVDSDGTLLSHEIEKWDESGDSFVWVRVPQIDGSSDTDYIWMYYGNTSAIDGQDAAGVYDSNYLGVWHLSESSGTLYDSTANANNGTPEGTPVSIIGGVVNGAQDFDAGSDRVSIAINLPETVTISTWAKLDTQGDMLWCVNRSGGPDLCFTGDSIYLNTWDGTGNPFCVQPANVDLWHYYTAILSAANTELYIDSVSCGTATYRNPSGSIMYFGSSSTTYTWDGSIDEFRVSNITRSEDWIRAQYLSMNDGLITFKAEE